MTTHNEAAAMRLLRKLLIEIPLVLNEGGYLVVDTAPNMESEFGTIIDLAPDELQIARWLGVK